MYNAVFRDHKDGLTYAFSEDALSLYEEFGGGIC